MIFWWRWLLHAVIGIAVMSAVVAVGFAIWKSQYLQSVILGGFFLLLVMHGAAKLGALVCRTWERL